MNTEFLTSGVQLSLRDLLLIATIMVGSVSWLYRDLAKIRERLTRIETVIGIDRA